MSSSINPQNNRDLNQGISTSGPNLVAPAWTGDELSRGQAQNGVNFDFEVKFDLEGHPKNKGILTKVFHTYGLNLVILAWTGYELSRGQTWWRTDGLAQMIVCYLTAPSHSLKQYWYTIKCLYNVV